MAVKGKKDGGKEWSVKRQPDEEIPVYKKNQVARILSLVKRNKVIGLVNIKGIPGAQMQQMRRGLHEGVEMMVVRNNLLYLALKEAYPDLPAIDELLGSVEGQTAVVATNLNPFRLYKQMEATKTKSPAKGGEMAPDDVVVPEGETEFKAGPIVGDLQKVGIPAGIESGKVVIKKTKTVVESGGTISRELAAMLTRLNILPLTVGLDLRAALEEGTIYKKDVLAVDETVIVSQISTGATGAFNLAMFIAYPTERTIRPLISKAYSEAMGIAMEASVLNKESLGPLLAKAVAQATVLKARVEGKPVGPMDPITGDALGGEPPQDGKDDKDKKKEDKEEEKVSEEEAAAGLGSLFGD